MNIFLFIICIKFLKAALIRFGKIQILGDSTATNSLEGIFPCTQISAMVFVGRCCTSQWLNIFIRNAIPIKFAPYAIQYNLFSSSTIITVASPRYVILGPMATCP